MLLSSLPETRLFPQILASVGYGVPQRNEKVFLHEVHLYRLVFPRFVLVNPKRMMLPLPLLPCRAHSALGQDLLLIVFLMVASMVVLAELGRNTYHLNGLEARYQQGMTEAPNDVAGVDRLVRKW